MFSELVIAVTLLVNSAAILNFRLKKDTYDSQGFIDVERRGVGDSVREFLSSLRYFRIFIALWNLFVMLLMILFFGH